jgi:drug/metabolite transporter (DMT)-like permease
LLLALSLVFAVALWGGNNAGARLLVQTWPPIWTGGSRFFLAGMILSLLIRHTTWFGGRHEVSPELRRRLWWPGGASLAIYIVVFNTALQFTTASHVALYLGASPVWALVWERLPARSWDTVRRYFAAFIALAGVAVLFFPSLKNSNTSWAGEVLGLAASVLWTTYGRQCRQLSEHLSGAEVSAHTMWRAGALLLPLSLPSLVMHGLEIRADLVLVQLYCITAGGVVAFGLWSNALRHWPASQVLLFNNLIPLSTTTWAHLCLKEQITPLFWVAMGLIVFGVIVGQANWQRLLGWRQVPPE